MRVKPLLPANHRPTHRVEAFHTQLLKWIGNKQRFAAEISGYFPAKFNRYFEPFLGSGAVLGTLGHRRSFGSDVFEPLVEIWQTLATDPDKLKRWYRGRWRSVMSGDRREGYARVLASYNQSPNGADLVFLCRSCYGGVVRFRRSDGFMSTPCGAHTPITPESFDRRVELWAERTAGAEFAKMDYREAMNRAQAGDVVYCDPPYSDTQSILYGAQAFSLADLFEAISDCKHRGVFVALSMDGSKRSGEKRCDIAIPTNLFQKELLVNCGRSMLRRFQMEGETLESEVVADRLLLTE